MGPDLDFCPGQAPFVSQRCLRTLGAPQVDHAFDLRLLSIQLAEDVAGHVVVGRPAEKCVDSSPLQPAPNSSRRAAKATSSPTSCTASKSGSAAMITLARASSLASKSARSASCGWKKFSMFQVMIVNTAPPDPSAEECPPPSLGSGTPKRRSGLRNRPASAPAGARRDRAWLLGAVAPAAPGYGRDHARAVEVSLSGPFRDSLP